MTEIVRLIEAVKKEVQSYQVPVVDLIAVQTGDPFKVLVATILSARTRDDVTASASTRLFKKASDAAALARLSEEEISKLIYPVGFYKSKAGYLARLSAALEPFSGRIPDDIDSLLQLPGVGRKTANLVLSAAFGKPAICVDTHVHRIMNLWGYVKTRTPLETEMALREKLPEKYWIEINSILVAFGQGTCKPVAPHCDRCVIQELCPKIGVTPRQIPSSKNRSKSGGGRTFISWNVNGIRAVEKKGFVDIVKGLSPDIFAIQETKAQPDQLSEALLKIDGYTSYWHGAVRKGYSGVAVYAKAEPLSVIYGLGDESFDQEGRVLTLEYNDFYLINAYFPNARPGLVRIGYKLDFNRALHRFVTGLAEKKSAVICGDFNVAHKAIDLKNPASNEKNPGYSPEERAWMDTFIGAGFIDTFRKFDSGPDNYTWWSYRFNARARNIGWRIDYFCVDPGSDSRVTGAGILKDVTGSDHCPIRLEFR
ncbi:MAG: exodeoxyribonuclease III [Desulfobacterales bacterium]|nr:exodeoxyribonuclease III [Desulfobacterales bacterium]MDD4073372.1 exodeoxyribonuclease III [Desulfobacterales bacterium]MDD4392482.1 exodeoxyribonuclease III [Desulfobacterales bacterium]